MKDLQIGDKVQVKARIVDYNTDKIKVEIIGYAEDKEKSVSRYVWLDKDDVRKGW